MNKETYFTKMCNGSLVDGIHMTYLDENFACDSCNLGKINRKSYQETRSCLSAKVYARDRPCIYTRAGELRAPEIIRSQ